MSRTLFVTGTDTGCGKTVATCALTRALAARGLRVACFKPLASGAAVTTQGLRNDDALALQAAASVRLDYDTVNPYAFEPPIAPHIAAERAVVRIDPDAIARTVEAVEADIRLVEGVGGWLVPLGDGRLLPELPRKLGAGVVLVVGLRLGCLNHALLTARAIHSDKIDLVGWIANSVDPEMAEVEANLACLEEHIGAPLLGRIDHAPDPLAVNLSGFEGF